MAVKRWQGQQIITIRCKLLKEGGRANHTREGGRDKVKVKIRPESDIDHYDSGISIIFFDDLLSICMSAAESQTRRSFHMTLSHNMRIQFGILKCQRVYNIHAVDYILGCSGAH